MKIRNLFLATTALAALASCSKDRVLDANQGNAISMKAFLSKPISRAVDMTSANMVSFKVHAHSASNSGFDFTDVFKNSTGGSGDWNSDNKHYWPGDDSELEFFAYAPASTVAATDGKTIPYDITAASAKDQKDLVVGFSKGRKSLNEVSGLPMNFRHALSQVVIQAKNSNTTNMKVEVIGVKIGFVKSKGTLNMPTAATTAAGGALLPSSNWTAQAATERNYTAGSDDNTTTPGTSGAIVLSGTATDLQFGEGGFMLLPQNQPKWSSNGAADGAYLSVLCRISQSDGAGHWNLLFPKPNTTSYAYSAVPVAVNWEPGKKYTYTLDFFGNGGGGQVDPDDPNGGDHIVGGPIKFTVTVDGWNDVNKDIDL